MHWGARIALVAFTGCAATPSDSDGPSAARLPPPSLATAERPFEPLPQTMDLSQPVVELGRRLFEEPLVSGSGDRACVDCHALSEGGVVPGEERSNHPMTDSGPYNVPTVFNVAFNYRYNWQGRFSTLEDHLGGPMMSASVMDAGSWPALIERLRPSYEDDFRRAGYAAGLSEVSIRDALATYQRSLVTPDGRFDRFLRGELELTPAEARGFQSFRDLGCATCHQGINVGGNLVQPFGVMEDAFERPLLEPDYGRMLLTGDEADAHVFRVPSLRNVALTAPYFHDGSAQTLPDAVRKMARMQLGFRPTDDETDDIVAFLHTLTGTYQGRPLSLPGEP